VTDTLITAWRHIAPIDYRACFPAPASTSPPRGERTTQSVGDRGTDGPGYATTSSGQRGL
jgi:hypothetical protein